MQIYRILGRTVVTYPKLLDETDFYMALDMSLLIDEIKVRMLLNNNEQTYTEKSSELLTISAFSFFSCKFN